MSSSEKSPYGKRRGSGRRYAEEDQNSSSEEERHSWRKSNRRPQSSSYSSRPLPSKDSANEETRYTQIKRTIRSRSRSRRPSIENIRSARQREVRSRSISKRRRPTSTSRSKRRLSRSRSGSRSGSRKYRRTNCSPRARNRQNSRSRSRSNPHYGRDYSYGTYNDRSFGRSQVSPPSGRGYGDRDHPEPSRCLGVFGLSFYTEEEDLRDVFGKYGFIEEIRVIYDHQTRKSRGFAFVYFEDLDDAKLARDRCNGLELNGREIRVDFSLRKGGAYAPNPGSYMGNYTYPRYSTGGNREYENRSYSPY